MQVRKPVSQMDAGGRYVADVTVPVMFSPFHGTRFLSCQAQLVAGWAYLDLDAMRDCGGYLFVKPGQHRQIGKCGALYENWIDGIEPESERYHASRCHLVEHPCRGDAALGGFQDQDTAHVG